MKVPLSTVAAEYIGFIVAFAANICLIYLILTQTKQNFGTYKYLMLCFAVWSLWYSFIDIMAQPAMYIYKNAFIVICASWFKYNQSLGPIIITTYCSSYGLTVVLLAIHFVYRYIAISRPSELRYFRFPLSLIWLAVFFIPGIFWWCNVYFFMGVSDTMNNYMRDTIAENYQDDIEKLSYIGPLYYLVGENGEIQIQWLICIGMINVITVSMTALTTIITFGYRIHRDMQRVKQMVAEKTRSLQRQLYYALMVQTLVPIVFMFTPTSILFAAPVFGIKLGGMANMTSICLALYPALDPLVVMYFIRDYRKYICMIPSELPSLSPIQSRLPPRPSGLPPLPSEFPPLPSGLPSLPSHPSELPPKPSELSPLPSEIPPFLSELPSLPPHPSGLPPRPSGLPLRPSEHPPKPSELSPLPSEIPPFLSELPSLPPHPSGLPPRPSGLPLRPSEHPPKPSELPPRPSGLPPLPSGFSSLPPQPSGLPPRPSGLPPHPSGLLPRPSELPPRPSGLPLKPSGLPPLPSGLSSLPTHPFGLPPKPSELSPRPSELPPLPSRPSGSPPSGPSEASSNFFAVHV